ncbi:MAG TPA: calcium/sodium antiporter [Sulfurivirga caldicuralii]|nr:calcium/sodium antiporter [Sulfurivirga caldicuralii]
MNELLLPAIALLIGLVLLVKSADIFIEGAASTAIHLNVSTLIIGVLVLGFGTSMPEVIVSILAALDHAPELAVGNAIGSNIANVGLVLGATALLTPVMVQSGVLRRELPLLLVITILAGLLLLDGELQRIDGILLLLGLFGSMAWMIHINRQSEPTDPLEQEIQHELQEVARIPLKKALIWTIGGLIVLMLSARMMVWGAVEIADIFGVSEAIIGLTIVAIGTSLPELAAGITAARKGEADLMLGNILGSNMFNLLAVMAMPALIYPASLNGDIIVRDYPIMLGFTLAMLIFALPRPGRPAHINRLEGALLMGAFFGYLLLLYFATVKTL